MKHLGLSFKCKLLYVYMHGIDLNCFYLLIYTTDCTMYKLMLININSYTSINTESIL